MKYCKIAILSITFPILALTFFNPYSYPFMGFLGEFFFFFGWLGFPIVGVVLSIIALRKKQPKWLAITGLMLSVIAILFIFSYLQVLYPRAYLPSYCRAPSGFGCVNYRGAPDGTVNMTLVNNIGRNIWQLNFSMGDCEHMINDWEYRKPFSITCNIPPKENVIKGNFKLVWLETENNSLNREEGEVLIKLE